MHHVCMFFPFQDNVRSQVVSLNCLSTVRHHIFREMHLKHTVLNVSVVIICGGQNYCTSWCINLTVVMMVLSTGIEYIFYIYSVQKVLECIGLEYPCENLNARLMSNCLIYSFCIFKVTF